MRHLGVRSAAGTEHFGICLIICGHGGLRLGQIPERQREAPAPLVTSDHDPRVHLLKAG